jgi:hypothetical protein
VTSPDYGPYEKVPAPPRPLNADPAASAEYGPAHSRCCRPDPGRLPAHCRSNRRHKCTAGRSCPGERRRGPHPHAGRRIMGYYLDRGVNARIRRLTHGAPTGRRESAQEQSGPPRLAESTALCRSLSPGCGYTLVPLTRRVLGGALALGKLFDLQIASDIRPLSSDEQALALLESATATPHGSVSPRVSPAGASA